MRKYSLAEPPVVVCVFGVTCTIYGVDALNVVVGVIVNVSVVLFQVLAAATALPIPPY